MHTQNVNVKVAGEETAGRWGERLKKMGLPLESMPGTEILIEWSKRSANAEKANRELREVLSEAMDLGYSDYWSSKNEAPGMFSNSPELTESWQIGWNRGKYEYDNPGECE